MANANLYFKFVDSTTKAGKTGLTVTANVYKLTKSGTKTTVATGASCAEVGGGVYAYNLSSPDFATYDYVATAAPSDATGLANADADAMWADFSPDVQSRIPAALTTDGNIKADALRLGGTLQTGRDIGASVLLSVGVGAGQVNLSSGTVPANVTQIAGQTASAAGTVTFPGAVASTTNITGGTITTVTNLTNAPTNGDLTAAMKTSISGLTIANVTTVATIGDSRIASILTAVTTPAATPTTDDIAAAVKTAIFTTVMASGSSSVYPTTQFGGYIWEMDKRIGTLFGDHATILQQTSRIHGATVGSITVTGNLIELEDGTTQEVSSSGRVTILA